MKFPRIFYLYALLVTSVFASVGLLSPPSIQTTLVFPPGSTYDKEWKRVDSLQDKGLYRSAMELVQSIYDKAKKDENTPQAVKALLHRLKYEQNIEEYDQEKAIDKLTKEIASTKFPLKNILYSITAETYWNYYHSNRWKILGRSVTVNFDAGSIETWDLNHITDQAFKHYLLSLSNEDSLKRTPLKPFGEILESGTSDARKIRPTLYDFLAHRAVDFFTGEEADITKPAYTFELQSEDYFQPYTNFPKFVLENKDSLSQKYYAMRIFQDLLAFHANDSNPATIIDADLKRLAFVRSKHTSPYRDSLYMEALLELEKRFYKHPSSTEVSFKIAMEYYERGNKYNARKSDDFKWDKKKALELCEQTISRHKYAYGIDQCKALKSRILDHTMDLKVEKVNFPEKPIKISFDFRNLKTVYFRIIAMDVDKFNKSIDRYYGEELMEKYRAMLPLKEWSAQLPDDGDFQLHNLELTLPALGNGHYLLLSGSDKSFNYKHEGFAYAPFWSSNISYISRKTDVDEVEFTLLDRTTGMPLAGATGQVFSEKYNNVTRKYEWIKGEKYNCDSNGYFSILPKGEHGRSFYVEFKNGSDVLHSDHSYYQYKRTPYTKYKNKRTFYFTDRAIYRPGQTIYFKGIVLETDGDEHKILPNTPVHVTLYDVNYQSVASLDLTTNEFGSYSGTFNAPMGVLNGNMHISDGHGTKYISVEEYKRPKFEVTMKPLDGEFRLNDEVKAEGFAKAFAGNAIDGAVVKYRVVRTAQFPYWCYWRGWDPTSPEMEITNGFTTTNDTGGFFVTFKLLPDASVMKKYSPTYTYKVHADITDINGETRTALGNVYASYTSLSLSTNIPAEIEIGKGLKQFLIYTKNLAGKPVPAKGTYQVFKLTVPGRTYRVRPWPVPDKFQMGWEEHEKNFPYDEFSKENDISQWNKSLVYSQAFDSYAYMGKKDGKDTGSIQGKVTNIFSNASMQPGIYQVIVTSKDKFNEEVKEEMIITAFNPKSNSIPDNSVFWFNNLTPTCEPGDTASFLIGTSEKDMIIRYEIEHENMVVKQSWIKISAYQKKITIPVEEKHRGNFSVHFVSVRNGRVYAQSSTVNVPWTNKELSIEYETFRNKLLPGESEEWKLKIKGPKGEKAMSEMVAAMYDASLDAFRANSWSFSIYRSMYGYRSWQSSYGFGYNDATNYSYYWNSSYSWSTRTYERLNMFGYRSNSYYSGYYGKQKYYYDGDDEMRSNDKASMKKMKLAETEMTDGNAPSGGAPEETKDASGKNGDVTTVTTFHTKLTLGGSGENGKQQPVKARSNFAETAFFFPDLHTDENGDLVIKFTVPESLTKWKVMGFAHTKDLKFGSVTKELVTQKELMVVSNPPRFFRENDHISFTAKITNLSANDLNGNADLVIYDALSMKEVTHKIMMAVHGTFSTIGERPFSAPKGKSTSITWDLVIPEGMGALTCKVIAKSGKFTDGEEMPVPVLTNRMLVTESMPLPIRSKQMKVFKFEKFISQNGGSSTLKNHKLTLEFTANPAWYAVQSLPYLMEYPYECSEQTFSRFYSNSIASHIANSSPKIKAVFDAWKSKSPDAFLSNLQKNQELKSLMLEETPWVLDAKDESERKKRVGLLFDLNKMSYELSKALTKLKKMQMSNGGWPWFEGMPDDRYITQHIVTGMGHLDKLGVKKIREEYSTWGMVKDGVRYLDNRIDEDYDWILKHDKARMHLDHVSYYHIQYLYARSYFKDVPMADKNKKAFDYFKGQAQKYWLSKGRYMQGMIALALNRYDDKKTPTDIMKSLKETALVSEEMGMYWKENYSGYYWYEAPIESQALLIEAFDEVAKDKKAVDDLKVWLLKSKQTQNWQTTKATTEAVYALLLRGTDWLSTETMVEIVMGDLKIDPKNLPDSKQEEGTGYFKTSWTGSDIKPDMGNVKVTKNDEGVSWGAVYWQYFEQLDKITPHETPLKLVKKLFVERNTAAGPVIEPVTDKSNIKVGDKIKVRIELRVDRDMEYVHMKDMRASGFEPKNVFSGYRWQDGLGYYESTRDAATNFFFNRLPKGNYVFEYPLYVSHEGDFSNGITTVQCMYAPEFTSHSVGIRVKVGKQP